MGGEYGYGTGVVREITEEVKKCRGDEWKGKGE